MKKITSGIAGILLVISQKLKDLREAFEKERACVLRELIRAARTQRNASQVAQEGAWKQRLPAACHSWSEQGLDSWDMPSDSVSFFWSVSASLWQFALIVLRTSMRPVHQMWS